MPWSRWAFGKWHLKFYPRCLEGCRCWFLSVFFIGGEKQKILESVHYDILLLRIVTIIMLMLMLMLLLLLSLLFLFLFLYFRRSLKEKQLKDLQGRLEIASHLFYRDQLYDYHV